MIWSSFLKIMKGNPYQYRVKDGYEGNVWFISDTHFNHTNILDFCCRPFPDIHVMNEELIARWNSVVGENDVVFHLGDFAMSNIEDTIESIFKRLNGEKILILGNHDTGRYGTLVQCFGADHIFPALQLVFGGSSTIHETVKRPEYVWLSHFPTLASPANDNRPNKSSVFFQLHGHVHTSKYGLYTNMDTERMKNAAKGKQYDVGADNNNYTPISYKQLIEYGFLNFD